MSDNTTRTYSTEEKFKTLYNERRRLFDQGKDIGDTLTIKNYFYKLAEAFDKSDLYAIIDEIKFLDSTEDMKTPFAMSSVNKIEKQLAKQTVLNKSARWQLLMMMCDWMDVLMDRSPRPVKSKTNIFTDVLQPKGRPNIYEELIGKNRQ